MVIIPERYRKAELAAIKRVEKIILDQLSRYKEGPDTAAFPDQIIFPLRESPSIERSLEDCLLVQTIEKIQELFCPSIELSQFETILRNGVKTDKETFYIYRDRKKSEYRGSSYLIYEGQQQQNRKTLYCFTSSAELNEYVERKKLRPALVFFGPAIICDENGNWVEQKQKKAPVQDYETKTGRLYISRTEKMASLPNQVFDITFLSKILDLRDRNIIGLLPYLLVAYIANWPRNAPIKKSLMAQGKIKTEEQATLLEDSIINLARTFSITAETMKNCVKPQTWLSNGMPSIYYPCYSTPWEEADALIQLYNEIKGILLDFQRAHEFNYSTFISNIDFAACDGLFYAKTGFKNWPIET